MEGRTSRRSPRREISRTEVNYLYSSRETRSDAALEPPRRYVMRYGLSREEVVTDSAAAAWKPAGNPEAFAPLLLAGVLPDGGIAFTDSSAYSIKIMGPDGTLSRILTRPFSPAPVTDRMKAAYIEGEMERLERSIERSADPMEKAMAEFRRAQLESIEYFHEVPVLLDLRTSPEGTIWVGRRGEDPGSSGPIWRRHPGNPILQSCASPL